ncbi:MAG: cohesin domain-containing protein [Saprospiraceae bacterium]
MRASSAMTEQGERVEIDITTSNFANLIGLQFTLEWDSTVIDLVSIDNLGLPALTQDNINASRTGEGLLAMAWLDNSLEGIDLPDETTIFTVTYEVVGESGDSSLIEFTDNIALVEAIDSSSTEIAVTRFSGVVSLDEINPISDFSQNILALQQNYPNPFTESTIISANFAEPTVAVLHIFNSNGQRIHTHKERYSAGDHSLFIDHKIFPTTGTYQYQLQTATHTITKSLIYIE